MKLVYCLTITFFSVFNIALAQDIPVTGETKSKGYADYPVLQCPKTSDQMKSLLNKLNTLKDSIKKNANCDEKKSAATIEDINQLSSLVGDERKNFLSLIQKGQAEGLNEKEQDTIQNYVSGIVKTSDSLIKVLSGKDSCFPEDSKANSLILITSLIGEGSKILGMLGGPAFAGTVAIASNIITGFLEGMENVRKNTPGFKFEIYEQREAYSESLCSLFEYKKEIRSFLSPRNTIQNLTKLDSTIKKQLSLISSNCRVCQQIIDRVSAESASKARAELWSKPFEDEIKKLAGEINKEYARPLGTHTYRSLKTKAWIQDRIAALKNNPTEADLGLQEVMTRISTIEDFMIQQESYRFLNHQIEKTREDFNVLIGRMGGLSARLLYDLRQPVPKVEPTTDLSPFRIITASKSNMQGLNSAYDKVDRWGRGQIESLMDQIDSSLDLTLINVGVIERYCTFFLNARWFPRYIEKSCNDFLYTQIKKDVYKLVENRFLMNTLPLATDLEKRLRDQQEEDPAPQKSKRWAQDWTESLNLMVDEWTKNPYDYVRRAN